MTIPVLIVNGTIGSGKSTIGLAINEILEREEVPHVYLDLDRLTDCYPKKGPFNDEIMFESLAALWPVYASAGADRLILARVVEDRSELESYERALGECSFTVALVTASETTRRTRISGREFGDSLKWHLDRSRQLDQILINSDAYDFAVHNEDNEPLKVANGILKRCGWIS